MILGSILKSEDVMFVIGKDVKEDVGEIVLNVSFVRKVWQTNSKIRSIFNWYILVYQSNYQICVDFSLLYLFPHSWLQPCDVIYKRNGNSTYCEIF